jgi:hypothetical protein
MTKNLTEIEFENCFEWTGAKTNQIRKMESITSYKINFLHTYCVKNEKI